MRALAGFSTEFRNYFVNPIEHEYKVFPEVESEMKIKNTRSTPKKAKIQLLELLQYLHMHTALITNKEPRSLAIHAVLP